MKIEDPKFTQRGFDGPDPGWPFWPPALAYIAAACAFYWPWLSGRVLIPWDAKAQFAPQVHFMAASLGRGEAPWWTPNVFAGMPQIADPQSLLFSPPYIVLALLDAAPSLGAIDKTLLVMVMVSGLAVIALARDLGWHWAGAVMAALVFSFGAAMAWRLQHTGQVLSLAYLPVTLLLLQRALTRGSILYGAAAGAAASAIVLGRDQVGLLAVYLLAGWVAWAIATAPDRGAALRRSLLLLIAGGIVGVTLVTLPLVMTVLLAEISNRPSIDFVGAGRGSLHPALLVTGLVPHLFGAAGRMEDYWGPPSFTWIGTDLFIAQNVGQVYLGAIPALLLIAGTVRGVLWERPIRFYAAAFLAVLIYALGWFTPAFRVMYEVLPGVSLYRRPADAVFLIGGLGALLSGYVVHRWLTGGLPAARTWQRALEIGSVAAVFALSAAFALAYDRLDRALPGLTVAAVAVAAAVVVLWATENQRLLRPVTAGLLLVAATTADLVANNGPNGASAIAPEAVAMLEPRAQNATVALLKSRLAETAKASPNHRDRVELVGLGFHWPNASLTHGLDHTLGYNPVRLSDYTAATGAGDTVGLPDQRKFTALFPSYNSRLADLLGLRWIASGVPIEAIDKALPAGSLTLLARTPEAYVYENPRALPRVLFAHDAVTAPFRDILETGRWPPGDPSTGVVIETPTLQVVRRPGRAELATYTNTEIEIAADSPDGGWVVLNDVWHPWWRATVDGQPAAVEKANVIFRAVAVPPGRHTVRLTFRPLAGVMEALRARLR